MLRCINEGSDELFFDFGGSRAISKDSALALAK